MGTSDGTYQAMVKYDIYEWNNGALASVGGDSMMPGMIQVWTTVRGQLVVRTCDNNASYPEGLQWGASQMLNVATGKFEDL